MTTIMIAIAGMMVVVIAHELKPIIAAYPWGSRATNFGNTYGILTFEITYPDDPPSSKLGIRIMALAPLLVGITIGTVVFVTGGWDWPTPRPAQVPEGRRRCQ